MFPVYLHPYLLLCVGSGVSTYNMSVCLCDEYMFCVIYLRYDVVFLFVLGVVAHFDPHIFIVSQCFFSGVAARSRHEVSRHPKHGTFC